ncbi:MAG: cation-transporting P-type ATPase, partial [Rubrivivax sp.]
MSNSPTPTAAATDSCCACGTAPAAVALPGIKVPGNWQRFRIVTMDCAVEESEIRHAVDGIPGLRGLRFQLSQRTLAIDAAGPDSLAATLAAIRRAGFDPTPLGQAAAASAPGA